MQTFLPYRNFRSSLSALDMRRLGKQRVEAYQIIKALSDPTYGWQKHPAVNMWRGYTDSLKYYYNTSLEVFDYRGGTNIRLKPMVLPPYPLIHPPWLGDEAFHASHRSNLLRKDGKFYARYGWKESPDLPYVWPV